MNITTGIENITQEKEDLLKKIPQNLLQNKRPPTERSGFRSQIADIQKELRQNQTGGLKTEKERREEMLQSLQSPLEEVEKDIQDAGGTILHSPQRLTIP